MVTINTVEFETQAPFRGPSGYQSRNQYYDVLNLFFSRGVRRRVTAKFKRIGDLHGWSRTPETREGLELDRVTLLAEGFDNANARMDELAADGCEFVSYRKHPAPGGRVTYLLVSWPTNSELERNRFARVLRKQAKQAPLPRAATPFQHPQPRHTAEFSERERPAGDTRQSRAEWFEREFGKPAQSKAPADSTIELELPLFAGVRQ